MSFRKTYLGSGDTAGATKATISTFGDYGIASSAYAAKVHSVIGFNGTGVDMYLQIWGTIDATAATLCSVVKVPAGQTGSIDYGVSGRPLAVDATTLLAGYLAVFSSTALTLTISAATDFLIDVTYS